MNEIPINTNAFTQCNLSLSIPIIENHLSNDQLDSFCKYLIPNNSNSYSNFSLLIKSTDITLLGI